MYSDTYRKLLNICLASSDALAFAKLMKEQYTAAQAAHLIYRNKIYVYELKKFMKNFEHNCKCSTVSAMW